MSMIRSLVVTLVVLAGAGAALALGRNDFLDTLVSQLTSAKAGIADPAQQQSIDTALATLQTAPGDAQFDNLAPDLKAAAKAVGQLGAAAADANVTAAVNAFVPVAFANVIGRGGQANAVATQALAGSNIFAFGKFVQKAAKILAALEKANADATLTPAKKLKKFAGFAAKYDGLYNKYK